MFDLECAPGEITACQLQIALICLLFRMKKWFFENACAITVSTSLLWTPFVFARVGYKHEQIIAILSFSPTGLSLCCYQLYMRKHKLLFARVGRYGPIRGGPVPYTDTGGPV